MNRSRFFVRTFVLSCVCSSSLFVARSSALEQGKVDHLVPIDEQREAGEPFASYRKSIERKLFVTPGDVARVVRLPGTMGVETVISLYRREQSKDAVYWITVTQPSKSLWNPEGASRSVKVKRLNALLPTSTALMVQKVWAAMLHNVRESEASDELIEASTQIFSMVERGTLLRGQAEGIPRGKVADLSRIADLLTDYCEASQPRRGNVAQQIETEAAKLLSQP